MEQLAGRVRAAARVRGPVPPGSVRDDALRLAADLLEDGVGGAASRPTGPTWSGPRSAGMVEAAQDRLRLTEAAGAGHGRRAAQGGRAARPGRRGRRGLGAPQRAAGDAGAGPARGGRRHLREPAQRHERRRRAVPQGGQRRLPARLVLGHRLQPGRRRAAAAGGRQGRPARGRRGPGRGHRRTRRPSPSCGCAGTSTA